MGKPTEGRIVHYVLKTGLFAGEHRAAILTGGADRPTQNMTVFLDQLQDLPGQEWPFLRGWGIAHDQETKAPGTWHWPEDSASAVDGTEGTEDTE